MADSLTIRPVTPDEIQEVKNNDIPPEIIEIFNLLIVKNWNGRSATVMQNTAMAQAVAKLDVSRQFIFDNHWMDVEDVFRRAGWKVEYDKPGHNESYEANFTFTKPTKNA